MVTCFVPVHQSLAVQEEEVLAYQIVEEWSLLK